ncbi:MAG: hypothetical protein HY680_06365 [Chloroflexi bacterium]|nr:hypothetical protein [Chloroflexota bacterium]
MSIKQLWAGAALLVALGVLATACASEPPAGGASTTTTTTSRKGAALAFDKTRVNLGNVEQDSQGVATFLAINYGALPISLGPVEVVSAPAEASGKSFQVAVSLGPTKVYPVPIALGPFTQLGPHRVQAKLASSDPKAPATTLTVDYMVVEGPAQVAKGPRLRLDKQFIDIGEVPYDWPLYEQFTLRNDGDAALVLAGTPSLRTELGC